MELADGSFWNPPERREALEVAIRSVAKTFGKEQEFDVFIKARNKLVMSTYDRHSLEYKALKEEYLKCNPDWLEPVARSFGTLYILGFQEGRSANMGERIKE